MKAVRKEDNEYGGMVMMGHREDGSMVGKK